VAAQPVLYKAEAADQLLIEPLDAMTLIYHRASGATHIVAEPVPEILAAMAADCIDAATLATRLAAQFELGDDPETHSAIAARLEELTALGLVRRA
jgi:PqqD family protein of HPr-rel-A system